jgi:hypothetical protein
MCRPKSIGDVDEALSLALGTVVPVIGRAAVVGFIVTDTEIRHCRPHARIR